MEKGTLFGRLGIVVTLCLAFQVFIVVRLAQLQIFEYSRFSIRVKDQSEAKVKVNPRRGKILDRHRRILATTINGKRVYPFAEVGGNLLGFVGKDGIGLEGIEYEFDPLLSGKPGWMTLGKTPRGHLYPYPGYPRKRIEPAKDIVLTIDADVQSIIERALVRRVNQLTAKRGCAVVLDPGSGEVLAMATVPSSNPNRWRAANNWRNAPLQDEFEPGSTFKIVTLSAVVEGKVVAVTDTVEDGSCEIMVKGKKIRDVRRHGPFTFEESVWRSSNVAFVRLSRMIGKQKLYDRAILLGFGTPTGVELPGETRGKLSSPSGWGELRFANLAFGHGVTCNLLQLAFAYQAIANGGMLLKPLIVKEVVSSSGKSLYKGESRRVRRVLPHETATEVTDLLCGVVSKGSGMLARMSDMRMAGKTGTANKCVKGRYTNSYISSFICFFPADAPIFLVACLIDEPKSLYLGGEVCGPLMREIVENLRYLRPYYKGNET
jgi:cell division protein FtsI/penicillin-binding protein 2